VERGHCVTHAGKRARKEQYTARRQNTSWGKWNGVAKGGCGYGVCRTVSGIYGWRVGVIIFFLEWSCKWSCKRRVWVWRLQDSVWYLWLEGRCYNFLFGVAVATMRGNLGATGKVVVM